MEVDSLTTSEVRIINPLSLYTNTSGRAAKTHTPCCDMLRAFGQSIQHMTQHHATILQDVALKCCERLART